MELKDLQRANHYRSILLTSEEAQNAFIANPGEELSANAGIVLTAEQTAAVSQYIEASSSMRTIFKLPMGGPGPYDPGGPDTQGRKAPWWMHALLDIIWGLFSE